jgi:SAM-dependent methyltransferase
MSPAPHPRPTTAVYDSPRLAAGYAFDRPAVHVEIVRHIAARLPRPVARALDVGCGAGVSTAALDPLARTIVGLDPSATMLAHSQEVCPRGFFSVGRAEQLPFAPGVFDLVAAAGSINYAETPAFLRETSRVLTDHGVLTIYDFSDGKQFRDDDGLQRWYEEFERLYPPQPGYALDVRRLPFEDAGLRLDAYQELQVAVPMSAASYQRYAMSQTTVEAAIAGGTSEADIARWCAETLGEVFGEGSRDVLFDAYVAYVSRTP